MAYETILVETRGKVGLVTLNRPKALNALNSKVLEEVLAALTAFDAATGSIVAELGLYPGGSRTGRPGSRLLQVESNGELRFSGGFLSQVRIDTHALAADVLDACHLG